MRNKKQRNFSKKNIPTPALLCLKKIPKGKVTTYKELARACGTSPRAVGRMMACNPYPQEYHCYKMVSSRGELCGYSGHGGLKAKKKLLEKEGIEVHNGKVDLKRFLFRFD